MDSLNNFIKNMNNTIVSKEIAHFMDLKLIRVVLYFFLAV